MAQRRMFSLKVIDTDNFLDMSPTAQNLYFHLGMRADDDGFVASPKKIMQMCGSPDDDMRVLITKGFIIPMSTNGVCVITHWKVNNLIRPDRYLETEYLEEKNRLKIEQNKWKINIGIPNDIPLVATGKDRLGKDILATPSVAGKEINRFIELFKSINPSYKKFYSNKTQRGALERVLNELGQEKLTKVLEVIPQVSNMQYAPVITTPLQLEDKLAALISFLQKENSKKINKTIII